MNLGLKNKHVLITGASRGIGFAIAELLVQQEATIIMCSRDKTRLVAARDDLDQRYPAIEKYIYALDLEGVYEIIILLSFGYYLVI